MIDDCIEWISENPRHVRSAGYLCIGALLLGAVRTSGLANRIRRPSDLVRSDFEARRRLRVAFEGIDSRGSLIVTHEPWFQRNLSLFTPTFLRSNKETMNVDLYGVGIREDVSRFLRVGSGLRLTLLSLGNNENPDHLVCFVHYFGLPLNGFGITRWRSLGVEFAELGLAETQDGGLGKHASTRVGHRRDLERELKLIGEAEERSRMFNRGIWKYRNSSSNVSERFVRAVPLFTRILQSYRAWRDRARQ